MEMHRTVPTHCLGCGKLLDAASSPFTGDRPSPGDYTVCLDCGHVMVYDSDMGLRNPTDAEILEAAGDKDILLIQRARKELDDECPDDR